MPRERPTSVLVMAILNFVFGGLGVVCVCCAGISLALMFGLASGSPEFAKYSAAIEREIPAYKIIAIASLVISLFLSILLIASGAGLLSMQTWGRWTAVVWAVLSILYSILVLVLTVFVSNPVMERAAKELPGGGGGQAVMGEIVGIVEYGVIIIYAIALLIVMFLPDVSAAFAGSPRQRRTSGDEWSDV
jgi:hypothetical protein